MIAKPIAAADHKPLCLAENPIHQLSRVLSEHQEHLNLRPSGTHSVHYEVSLVVNVPRDKAYSAYTDFEAMPRWSKQGATREKVCSAAEKSKLFPPERVESEVETRSRTSKSVVTFEEVSGGTKVTASLDVRLKGHWSWILKTRSKADAESSAMEELASFAKYAEGVL